MEEAGLAKTAVFVAAGTVVLSKWGCPKIGYLIGVPVKRGSYYWGIYIGVPLIVTPQNHNSKVFVGCQRPCNNTVVCLVVGLRVERLGFSWV